MCGSSGLDLALTFLFLYGEKSLTADETWGLKTQLGETERRECLQNTQRTGEFLLYRGFN